MDTGQFHGDLPVAAHRAGYVGNEVVEVDRRCVGGDTGVEPGQDEQLFGEPLHAEAGDGCPEFVGGIADEPALTLHSCMDAIQHPVHGCCQPADLVVGGWLGDPPGEVLGVDGVALPPDRFDGGQGATDHQPQGPSEDHEQHRQACQPDPSCCGDDLVDLAERHDNVDDPDT